MKRIIAALFLVILASMLPSCGAEDRGMQVLPALREGGWQGKLIFIMYQQKGNRLVELDLASGAARTLFAAPEKSWLASADVSPDGVPDGGSILLAYAPPPPKNQVQLANTDLYRLSADGSGAPQPLIQRGGPNESYTYPAWAPDGQTFYYTHSAPSKTSRMGIESNIERARVGGEAEIILRGATWPRLSPDGARLVYLGLSEFTSNNSLYLANADGSSPVELVPAREFPIVDAPLFSPDGRQVYFSAPVTSAGSAPPNGEASAELARLAWPFGVRPVTAHSDPADWFRVSVEGGQAQRVTNAQDVNMVATFSPDGQWLAYASQKGLFVMRPDGSQHTQIASLVAMGSIHWLE